MDLEAILTLFDQYSFASIVLDRFRVSCMWLDGGLILCPCLYNRFTYLRGSNLVQKQQVESPVNILGFLLPITAGPLNISRERTLATQSYLGQHQSSSTLLHNPKHMPETVKQDYRFCQYQNPALAHDNGPCDCLTKCNGTK
jgi:hypothetical protein